MIFGASSIARIIASGAALCALHELWMAARATVRLDGFGEAKLLMPLVEGYASGARRAQHLLRALGALALGAALLRPQLQNGTRLKPRAELDVVLVVDESKSMNARDIAPSRIERVKAELSQFVKQLPGARFAAVAYAGDALALPLTTDGSAVSQFLRALQPSDMPLGGTFTARALVRARDLLARERAGRLHTQRIILLTDGEDLEGDPVEVAKGLQSQGVVVDVVRVGVSAREAIPATDALGRPLGPEIDKQTGTPLMTEFGPEAEQQLRHVAEAGGGRYYAATPSDLGLAAIASALRAALPRTAEAQSEPTYAELGLWPTGLAAIALLLAEWLPSGRRRKGAPS